MSVVVVTTPTDVGRSMSHASARFTAAGRLLMGQRIEAGMPQAHVQPRWCRLIRNRSAFCPSATQTAAVKPSDSDGLLKCGYGIQAAPLAGQ